MTKNNNRFSIIEQKKIRAEHYGQIINGSFTLSGIAFALFGLLTSDPYKNIIIFVLAGLVGIFCIFVGVYYINKQSKLLDELLPDLK